MEVWPVAYRGFSGSLVDDGLRYDLPASHLLSVLHTSCCAYCLATDTKENQLVLDHIVPYSKGGSHLQREFSPIDNNALACWNCNTMKGEQIGWSTFDGRFGFYWDGTAGNESPPPLPRRSRWRK